MSTRFIFRRFLSLSGVFSLGVFLFAFLYLNAKALGPDGGESFDAHLRFLKSVPFLPAFEIFFVFLPLTICFVDGLLDFYRTKGGVSLRKIAWLSGFAFFYYHIYLTRFLGLSIGAPMNYSWMVWLFRNPWNSVIYVVGLSSLVFIFSGNIRNFMIDWGATSSPYSQKWGFCICLAFFVFLFSANLVIVSHYAFHDAAPPFVAGVLAFVRDFLFR